MTTPAPCDCCAVARTFAEYRMFNPACLWCGARLLRGLVELPITATELTRRRRGVVETWRKAGHDAERMKELAGAGVPIEPVKRAKGKA